MSPSAAMPQLGHALYQSFVQFPYSALTIPRQQKVKAAAMSRDSATGQSPFTLDESVARLCQSTESVSSLLARDPALAPGDAWKKLYRHEAKHVHKSLDVREIGKGEVNDAALERALSCGKWGKTQPSRLFLRLYHDSLCTLNDDPALAVASPSLLGSSGVVPLSIISVIPDIVRHMSNLIVRAEKEVFLATNYWANGVAAEYITNAMRELSRRAGERGTKIVMKVLYDRGNQKQLLKPHYIVSEKEFTGKAVNLPARHEIPNIDLEVMNFHDPMLGTFHSKFMVVDRKIGIVQSNNIQDNDNVEMMVQVEGPIVDGLYDMALLSWHKRLEPPLPSRETPAAEGGLGGFGPSHDAMFTDKGILRGHDAVVEPSKTEERAAPYGSEAGIKKPAHIGPSTNESTVPGIGEHASAGVTQTTSNEATNTAGGSQPGSQNNRADPVAQEFLRDGEQAMPQHKITMPAPDESLPENTADDPHYDVDIAGEVARVQASVSPRSGGSRMEAVTRHLNHTTNKDFKGDAPECDLADQMTPYIPHRVHEPFPIALVNRPPYGPPNHKSVSNPQNAVWLSALRNAQKNVFIQSPTLNAEPLVPAIIEACERGIDVYCYICIGYNDAGELLPMQGGTNEMVANHIYKTLSPSARQHIHYFWYVGKDQTRPIIQEKKHRSCHIKLMIVDESIGIVGSGNQDTQSWFHSQEVNLLLESKEVCKAWIDGLRRNQNTHKYGAVGREDGVWRDKDGKEAEGAIGIDPGHFSWAKGIVGAVQRVRGVGGF